MRQRRTPDVRLVLPSCPVPVVAQTTRAFGKIVRGEPELPLK